MASDRKIIEEQLAHAKKTGNKKRAAKLKKVLKSQKDYDKGKTQRGTAQAQDFDKNLHRARHYPGRTQADKVGSYVNSHVASTWYDGSGSIVKGDKKRARKQKAARHLRNAKHHTNSVVEHKAARIGFGVASGTALLGGAIHTEKALGHERKIKAKDQHGAESNKNRKKMRRGHAVSSAGMGALVLMQLTDRHRGKAALIGGAAYGGLGALAAKRLYPNNNTTSKKWVTFTKGKDGKAKRSTISNPYYYQQRGNKKVRVKKGKR